MLIYAHRGSSAVWPENTLAAFRQAMADGADGVELDVRATADWVPVVLHDRDLARTTDGRGLVDKLPLDAVQAVDAGAGERVPTLAEVMGVVANQARVNVEVKQAGIEREVMSVLSDHPTTEWAVSSFDWSALAAVRAIDHNAELWPVAYRFTEGLLAVARELRAAAVALRGDGVTPKVLHHAREAGMRVVVWTVNQVEEARRARELGAAGLCTDAPAEIRRGLTEGSGEASPDLGAVRQVASGFTVGVAPPLACGVSGVGIGDGIRSRTRAVWTAKSSPMSVDESRVIQSHG